MIFISRDGWTALHWACKSNKVEAAVFLVENTSVKLDIKDDRGQTAFQMFNGEKKKDLASALLNSSRSADIAREG